ncbi:TPA: AIM24 family protein [Candidatus Woesearchaeota archaeon]|nr:AIM24 family protein [Candidatus Woesearchaeota archaeon]HII69087.1 AIM24 family protein [Candidatus Woesearchaeota archaeon]
MSQIAIDNEGLSALVTIILSQGETFRTEYCQFRDCTPGIEMFTERRDNPWMRFMTGEHVYWQCYRANDGGTITLTNDKIGGVLLEKIDIGNEWCVDRSSLVGADGSVIIDRFVYSHLMGGIFGPGLFYHHLRGEGNALVSVDGKADLITLAQGEERIIDPDYLFMFRPGMDMALQRNQGLVNQFINGLFFLKITGPAEFYIDRIVGEHSNAGVVHKACSVIKDYLWPV